MLYFIGGAARTGKGILARRLLAEMGLPYLSLDVLKMGLARGAPEFPIDPNAGALQVAARLWPLVREMSASLLHDEMDYVFEGEIVPKDVHVLQQKYPAQIMGIFSWLHQHCSGRQITRRYGRIPGIPMIGQENTATKIYWRLFSAR